MALLTKDRIMADLIAQDAAFMDLLLPIASKSTCDMAVAGAVLVKDHAMFTAATGAPRGVPTCQQAGHQQENIRRLVPDATGMGGMKWHDYTVCTKAVDACTLALVRAGASGISTRGSTLYCTTIPPDHAVLALIEAGVIRVVAMFDREVSVRAKTLLAAASVALDVKDTRTWEAMAAECVAPPSDEMAAEGVE